jgi:hypothetical protein
MSDHIITVEARQNKRVTFETVEIIELPISIGDNPSVREGAPLTTEWVAQRRTTLNLEYFESYRPRRRSTRELILSQQDREDLLLRQGYTEDEIDEASNLVIKARELKKFGDIERYPERGQNHGRLSRLDRSQSERTLTVKHFDAEECCDVMRRQRRSVCQPKGRRIKEVSRGLLQAGIDIGM